MGYRSLNEENHPHYTHYKINEFGEIINSKTGNKKEPTQHRKGYFYVTLYGGFDKNGKRRQKKAYVHRLVMEHHDPKNYDPDLQVDHLDKKPENNHVDNLECVTLLENVFRKYNY